jgi:hypothetical protein
MTILGGLLIAFLPFVDDDSMKAFVITVPAAGVFYFFVTVGKAYNMWLARNTAGYVDNILDESPALRDHFERNPLLSLGLRSAGTLKQPEHENCSSHGDDHGTKR